MKSLLEYTNKELPDIVYHGTGSKFEEFSQDKARVVNDFYGGGVAYFTTDIGIAINYAKGARKRSADGIGRVYFCKVNLTKVFDVDRTYTGEELKKHLPKNLDAFARGAGLMRVSDDPYLVTARLERGDYKLTGEQIFRGISQGMVHTAKVREHLKKLGYDGLRYNGGQMMGVADHDVYIAYYAHDIEIVKRKRLKK